MSEFPILLSQKNQVLEDIQGFDLPPEDFEWELAQSNYEGMLVILVSRLVQKSTGYYFQFDFLRQDVHACTFSPGQSTITETNVTGVWESQIQYFHYWLGYLKREVEAPDLWKAIAAEKVLSEVSSEQYENDLFSKDEKHRIEVSLNEIKQYLISSRSFSTEQRKYLDARFSYLEDATTRLGRKDWIIIVVGTLTNTIFSLALTPSIARELFRLAGTLLGWVIKIPLLQ